jgi:hypothetical protein
MVALGGRVRHHRLASHGHYLNAVLALIVSL